MRVFFRHAQKMTRGNMPPGTFSKPPLSQQKLFELLKDRGLIIANPDEEQQARNALSLIGYYRLSGYMLPFQTKSGLKKHHFKANTSIKNILALYDFDCAIRRHCSVALEDIEIAFRTTFCDHMSQQKGAHWYLESGSFKPGGQLVHYDVIAKSVDFDVKANRPFRDPTDRHDFISHYYYKYSNPPTPAAWMVRECLSFRTWALMFVDIDDAHKKQICDAWKYPNGKRIRHDLFEGWIHSLSVFRNRCAHHARITARNMTFVPACSTEVSVVDLFDANNNNSLRSFIVVLAILLKSVNPNNTWLAELKAIFQKATLVDIPMAAGFKADWEDDLIWGL